MRRTDKKTEYFLNDKKVKRKDLHIRGLDSRVKYNRQMAFLPDMTTITEHKLSNGLTLRIITTKKGKLEA